MGNPVFYFKQQLTNGQSLTKFSKHALLQENDLKNWLNGNFGLNLQLLKLRLRLRRVISSFRLLYLLCFHEASLKVAKNRLGSADHRNWRPRYVCHAFTIPKNYHAMLFIYVQGMNARATDFSRMHATRMLPCKSQAVLTLSLIREIDASEFSLNFFEMNWSITKTILTFLRALQFQLQHLGTHKSTRITANKTGDNETFLKSKNRSHIKFSLHKGRGHVRGSAGEKWV